MKLTKARDLRVLSFDIECRPLHWYGGDFVSREVTAIACQWENSRRAECWLLGELTLPEMLEAFRERYEAADVVTGHYILGFDLPNLQGAMLEQRLPPLRGKRVQDTKVHLAARQGISVSQENLSAMLGIEAKKVQMDQGKWREANRLTADGLALTRKRVIGDVRQQLEMRRELIALGYLDRCPARWSPRTSRPLEYVA